MLWKIYVFFKFVIFHFFLMIQEIENLTNFLCSYVLGSNLQSFKNAKRLFIFQEMKLFNLKLKNSCFLGENFRLFHHSFFRRFHSFFHAFISSDVFIVDCICLLYCFFTVSQVLRFYVVVLRVLRIWGVAFYFQTLFTLYSFLLLSRLSWGWQFCLEGYRACHWGSKHRLGPLTRPVNNTINIFLINPNIILYYVLFVKYLWICKISLVSIGLKSTEKHFTTPFNRIFSYY